MLSMDPFTFLSDLDLLLLAYILLETHTNISWFWEAGLAGRLYREEQREIGRGYTRHPSQCFLWTLLPLAPPTTMPTHCCYRQQATDRYSLCTGVTPRKGRSKPLAGVTWVITRGKDRSPGSHLSAGILSL